MKDRPRSTRRAPAPVPHSTRSSRHRRRARATKLQETRPARSFRNGFSSRSRCLLTDTTLRDAHQSLLATRMRTYDMLAIADAYARLVPELFSLEMWGGATFDTSMRFLKESPWQRLADLRERIPNILFQMLLRASNAVGYTNYPDNVVRAFVQEAAAGGHRRLPHLRLAQLGAEHARGDGGRARNRRASAKPAICYTGDILDPEPAEVRPQVLRRAGEGAREDGRAHPGHQGHGRLVQAVRRRASWSRRSSRKSAFRSTSTRTTRAAVQAASILKAAEAGLDIADGAMAPMSGGTSQPNLNTLSKRCASRRATTGLDGAALDAIWPITGRQSASSTRRSKAPCRPPTPISISTRCPAGSTRISTSRRAALGLTPRWPEVCRMYADVNQLLGDIVKVTPTSKAVGDMALFLVANNLDADDDPRPEPRAGVSANRSSTCRPAGWGSRRAAFRRRCSSEFCATQKPVEGPARRIAAAGRLRRHCRESRRRSSAASRPTATWSRTCSTPGVRGVHRPRSRPIPTRACCRRRCSSTASEPGEEIAVDIEPGKTLIIKFLTVGEPHPDGRGPCSSS